MKNDFNRIEDLEDRVNNLISATEMLEKARAKLDEASQQLKNTDSNTTEIFTRLNNLEVILNNYGYPSPLKSEFTILSQNVQDTTSIINSLEQLFNQQSEKYKNEFSNIRDQLARIAQSIDKINIVEPVDPTDYESAMDSIRLSMREFTVAANENSKKTREIEMLVNDTINQFLSSISNLEGKISEFESRLTSVTNEYTGHFLQELQRLSEELNQFVAHFNIMSGNVIGKSEFQKLTDEMGNLSEKLNHLSSIPVMVYDLTERVNTVERINARFDDRIKNIYMQWFISYIGLVLFICSLAVMAMR